MIKIYHNPRCSKSRQTLALLKERDIEPVIVDYLNNPLTKKELKTITTMLNCTVRDIIRRSESEFKENNLKDQQLSDDDLYDAIVKMPKLLQRPIVVNGEKAAIGRPPEDVLSIL